jgi:hypothetical protein
VTSKEVTVEEMLENKRRKNKINNLISLVMLSIFSILIIIYALSKFEFFEKKKEDNIIKEKIITEIKTDENLPENLLDSLEIPRLAPKPILEPAKAARYEATPLPRTLIQKDPVKIKLQKTDIKKTETPTKTETKTKTTEPKVTATQSNTTVSTYGKLRVDSNPRGASVKINGVGRGITPLVVSDLPKHQTLSIVVTKKDYQTWSGSVTLLKDKTEIKANLVR